VWDYILEIKENRIIMLTTHSMEEADALCTRIGIMVNGELKSLGTPQELKHMVRTYSAAVSGHTTPLVPPPPDVLFAFLLYPSVPFTYSPHLLNHLLTHSMHSIYRISVPSASRTLI
jgi:hypothetical protein